MALDKPTLISDLIAIFSNPSTNSNVQTTAVQMADAIERYVKSGEVVGVCPPNGGMLTEGKVQ